MMIFQVKPTYSNKPHTSSTNRDGIITIRADGRGGWGGLNGAGIAK